MDRSQHELKPDDINQLLGELNDKLAERGEHARLIIGGGAVMTTCFNSRPSTQDIDGIFEPSPIIRLLVREIASEHSLDDDWLNDGMKGFVNPETMGTVPFADFSNLKVLRFDDRSMLALKLTAARFDGQKDLLDSLRLMQSLRIQTIDELYDLVSATAYRNQLTPKVDYFIQELFAEYEEGIESVGAGSEVATDVIEREAAPTQDLDEER